MKRRRRGLNRFRRRKEVASEGRLRDLVSSECRVFSGVSARASRVVRSDCTSVVPVLSGRAFVVQEAGGPIVVWLTIVVGKPLFLCSCGGHKESESHIIQQKLGVSSTCKHACALRTSLFDTAQGLGKESLTQL